jgi:hypothetical protein
MPDALQTLGATVGKGSPSPGTPIANVTDIQQPGRVGNVLESTNLSSVDGIKTYITSGVRDHGELQLSINYDPQDATHQELLSDLDSGASDLYTITYTDALSIAEFNGIVTAFDISNTLADDGKLEATVTIRRDGTGKVDPTTTP